MQQWFMSIIRIRLMYTTGCISCSCVLVQIVRIVDRLGTHVIQFVACQHFLWVTWGAVLCTELHCVLSMLVFFPLAVS